MRHLLLLLLLCPLADAEERWRLLPLGEAAVSAPAYTGTAAELVSARAPGGRFEGLAGATLRVEPAQPLAPGRLAILRGGWGDWTAATAVDLRLNDGPPVRLRLQGPRLAPGAALPASGLDLWECTEPLRRIELTVVGTEGGNRAAGAIALALARPAPALLPLAERPAEAAGARLRLTSPQPPAWVEVAASGNRFRHRVRAALRRAWPADGVLEVRWEDFQEAPDEDGPLPAASIDRLEIGDPQGLVQVLLADWEPLPGGGAEAPAWARLPPLDLRPDADGWRTGIPAWGFSRFGWNPYAGLLCGGISDWRLSCEVADDHGRRSGLDLDLRVGAPGGSFTHTVRRQVDWTGSDLLNVLRPAAAAGEMRAGHAFGADDARLRPATITASLLIPGVLVTSEADEFALQRPEGGAPPRLIACTAAGTATWIAAGSPALAEGWLAVVWPDRDLPVLIAPQHRPREVALLPGGVVLRFAGAAGQVAVGQPGGWRPVPGGDDLPARLAPACRRLAAQLRAYPRRVHQRFRAHADGMEISERFTHIFWDNDWGEAAEPTAPVPPTVAFAADQGQRIAWPAGRPGELGPATKYGPWRGFAGAEARWILPLPDHRQELFLRPLGDPLAARIAAAIATPPAAPETEARDNLAGFWLRTPAALALPLLDEAPRTAFLAGWRAALERSCAPGLWFLRREPFSGAQYAVSFGWRERSTNTLGDLNSGFGALLAPAALYTRLSGDWAWAAARWPVIDGALRYLLVQHDWIHMQSGARETGAASAIDMDVIAFAGAAGYLDLAEGLGREDEAALARLLLARLGLSLGLRWTGMAWIAPAVPRERWGSITHGFNERAGFDTLGLDWNPDLVQGELALGLSWMGNYAPVYRQHLAALGPDFWRWWEYDLVGRRLPDWRTDHPGNRNNHPANICSHLYLRALLGAPTGELRGELERQRLLPPTGRDVAMENAGLYALLLGRDAPLSLRAWGRAAPLAATWDAAAGRARLRFRSPVPAVAEVALARAPLRLAVDGRELAAPATPGVCRIAIPAGDSEVAVDFPLQP